MEINVAFTIKADSSAIAFAAALAGGKVPASTAAPVKALTPKPGAGDAGSSDKTDTTTGTVATLELLRAFISENPKKRTAIKAAIAAAGAASVSTLDETKYQAVYEAFKAL